MTSEQAAPWPVPADIAALIQRWRAQRPRYMQRFAADVELLDVPQGHLRMAFEVGPEWGHQLGLQGGIVAGLLDSAMAQAVILCSAFAVVPPTLELKVSFLAPAPPGAFVADGWIEHRGRSVAFLRGELRSAAGALVATGTATSRLVPRAAGAGA